MAVAATGRKWVTPGLILQVRCRPPECNGPAVSCIKPLGPDSGKSADVRFKGEGRDSRSYEGSSESAGERDIGIGFTVSRKVGNAVARNRARRRLKAVASLVLERDGRPGCDYVLIGRKGTLDRAYADLIKDLEDALRKIRRSPGHPAGPQGAQKRNSKVLGNLSGNGE